MILKPNKDIARKRQTNVSHEHRCKKHIQNYSKLRPIFKKIHHDHVDFTCGIQSRLNI